MDNKKGLTKDNPIVVDDMDMDVITVKGSPLKVLPQKKYRDSMLELDSESSGSEDENNQENVSTLRKRLKFSNDTSDSSDDDNDTTHPMYERPPAKYTAEEIIRILLQADSARVCKEKPTSVRRNATYVVDVRNLRDQDDIKKDEFGIWKYSGSHPQFFKVHQADGGYMTVEKCCPGASGQNVVLLRRLHCTHPSNAHFKRLICFITDAENRPHRYCLLVYRFPPDFTPKIASHGNSKRKKPFYPTWPSTMTLIKAECQDKGPKAIIEHVSIEVGGVTGASAPGELPRNEKQITNLKKRAKLKGPGCGPSGEIDELFVIMQKAYSEDPESKFIRSIRASPDPAIVLAKDYQICDIERFCTSSYEFGILTVDPTFSLGEFDVTPITYRHLLLTTKRNGKSPAFIGPVLVHYRKSFATYLFFASSLVGLSSQLQGIRAFGTDGEKALSDAFSHEFGFSQQLTCFLHVRRNIRAKLADCSIPSSLSTKILDDIFGKRVGGVFAEGLIDADNDTDFQNKLDYLVDSWQTLQTSSTCNLDKFIDYLKDTKAPILRNTMSRSLRVDCGLGNPPDIFTTNASESVNALLKHKMDYKRNQLPVFVSKVHEVVIEQQREVERAVIGRGKYQLREQYKYLEVPEHRWFTMNFDQRKKHLSRVQSVCLSDTVDSTTAISPSLKFTSASSPLSVSVDKASENVNVPLSCLQGIWEKAQKLLETPNAITPAPGQDQEARMVLSYSRNVPHLVTPRKGGEFCCSQSCPNWKSMGICSHVVAVAELNHKLDQFLSQRKRKKGVNVTKLLTASMPKGRGHKGGVTPRARTTPQPISSRMEMMATSAMGCTSQVLPTQPQQPGSVHMSGYSSPHFSMVHSPMNFYNPYPAYPTFPPFYQGLQHDSSPFFTSEQSNMQPMPFTVCFISGNISVCIGCKNKYSKQPKPPQDICIRHEGWREFTTGGKVQSKFGNVYYHCRKECIWLRCPKFTPADLLVPPDLPLLSIHKDLLFSEFAIEMH